MAPRNGCNSSRNSNKAKGKKTEQQTASPHAHAKSSEASPRRSRSRNNRLPPENVNNSPPKEVSSAVPQVTHIDEMNASSATLINSPTSSESLVVVEHVLKSQILQDTAVAPGGVSDNGGLENTSPPLDATGISPTMVPPPIIANSDNPLHSTPDDPWHLTYIELKAMRARMVTLERVEEATLDFAKQLQAFSGRTSSTETKVLAHTSKIQVHDTKIQALEKEIASLRSTVDDQQQTIQELQQIKVDLI